LRESDRDCRMNSNVELAKENMMAVGAEFNKIPQRNL
jgi:hypothetical protein